MFFYIVSYFTAYITLENGEELEDAVEKLNNTHLKDNIVTLKPIYSGKTMCIAHIPANYDDTMFTSLCEKYGKVDYAYIMRSSISGMSVFICTLHSSALTFLSKWSLLEQ